MQQTAALILYARWQSWEIPEMSYGMVGKRVLNEYEGISYSKQDRDLWKSPRSSRSTVVPVEIDSV